MGRIYKSEPIVPQNVKFDVQSTFPLDPREVVDTYLALISPSTWGEWTMRRWVTCLYKGMRVTVTNDPDPTKNGLYYLLNNNYIINSVDYNLSLANDWIKIGDGTSGGSTAITFRFW